MFEKASRLKLRFDSPRGLLSAEDLWDLPLTSSNGVNLDKLAITLAKQLKESSGESFVTPLTAANDLLQMRFDIIKHVIDVKLVERDAAKLRAEKLAQKDRLLEIIAKKQDEQLTGKSLEDLQKMVEAL